MGNVTDVTNFDKKEKIEAILKSLNMGTSINQACKAADISKVTLWRWRKKSKRLNNKILSILDSRTQTVEDALYKAAIGGNIVAQIFWLKNRAHDRWKDRYEQLLGGEVKLKPLTVIIRKKNE